MKKFTALSFIVAASSFFLTIGAWADERVVILAPAAADVLQQLGMDQEIVGVTDNIAAFPGAAKVGTHLHPGIETIASLRPTFIIAGAGFDPDIAARMHAGLYLYNPKTLEDIIASVRLLAKRLGHEAGGETLARSLERILLKVRMPAERPSVLYETRSTPVAVAGGNTIIKDLLEKAGMVYFSPHAGGAVSVEYLLAHQPDVYIYQVGPMNKAPVPPAGRAGWDRFTACVWKVDEFSFARPHTQIFQTLLELNEIVNSDAVCAAGRKRYPEQ